MIVSRPVSQDARAETSLKTQIPSGVRKRQGELPCGSIQKKVWIQASAGVIFRALTDSRELTHWFCDRASSDPREGGELIAYWRTRRSGEKGRAVFTRIVPGEAVELRWVDDGEGAAGSGHTLSYEIRSKSGMTEVVMLDNDDATPDEETYVYLDQGWNTVLLELKDYCERRERSLKTRVGARKRSGESPPD